MFARGDRSLRGILLLVAGTCFFVLTCWKPLFVVGGFHGPLLKANVVSGSSCDDAASLAGSASRLFCTVSLVAVAVSGLCCRHGWRLADRAVCGLKDARRAAQVQLRAGPTLYGSQGSRSPLVNWYLHELGQEFTFIDAATVSRGSSDFPHPFGQIPALRDGNQQVFESGAILMYIADKYGGLTTPELRAEASKWVFWANATLDPICFLETEDGRVYGTGLRGDPRAIGTLDRLLSEKEFLLGDTFSVADVAVGAYLLYVPQFFPDIDVSKWPNVQRYMKLLCERPAYVQAFGQGTASRVAAIVSGQGGQSKLFGLF